MELAVRVLRALVEKGRREWALEVEVAGWFRRGLVPYVELSKLTDGSGQSRRLYSRWIQCVAAAAAVILGWLWMTGGF
jgi:hypothetical protein